MPAIADAIGVQATMLRHTSKELSAVLGEFAHPRNGAVPRVNEALSWMKADLKNAGDHVRVQMNGLGKELWRTIAILCFGALVIGFLIGILYHRSIDVPEYSSQPSTAAVPSASPLSSTPPPQPNHKKRLQTNGPSQVQ